MGIYRNFCKGQRPLHFLLLSDLFLPFLSSSFPSLSFFSLPFPSPSSPCPAWCEAASLNPARGSGKRCNIPYPGSPGCKHIRYVLSPWSVSWWQRFRFLYGTKFCNWCLYSFWGGGASVPCSCLRAPMVARKLRFFATTVGGREDGEINFSVVGNRHRLHLCCLFLVCLSNDGQIQQQVYLLHHTFSFSVGLYRRHTRREAHVSQK